MGYGDIASDTEFEKIVAIVWMMFGVGFYSFTIGSLTSLMSSIDSKEKIM